jgi:hypothetical protein
MAEHRIVVNDEKTWPHTDSTSHRVRCEGCNVNVKVVGQDAASIVDLICTHHGAREGR